MKSEQRFLSVDPLTKSYPWYTPYQFAGNKPIWAIDLVGLEESIATRQQAWAQEAFLKNTITKEELLDTYKAQAIGAGVGVSVLVTRGAVLKYGKSFLFWLANPTNQAIVAEGGVLVAAAIDPNPTAQYSTGGAGDEIGNMFGLGIRNLFRGTSSSLFKGSNAMIEAGVTSTSHNPLVSALYAIYNKSNSGTGKLLVANIDELSNVKVIEGSLNVLAHDREVTLSMLPEMFAKVAKEYDISKVSDVLKKMSFEVPNQIKSLDQLDNYIKASPEMTPDQISTFVEQITK